MNRVLQNYRKSNIIITCLFLYFWRYNVYLRDYLSIFVIIYLTDIYIKNIHIVICLLLYVLLCIYYALLYLYFSSFYIMK